MSIDHIISAICNSRIGELILIANRTTLLDYGHQFMGSLYAVDNRLQTQASPCCYLIRYYNVVDSL